MKILKYKLIILISHHQKKFQINKNEINILLGIGGSGPTKRIPAKTFIKSN